MISSISRSLWSDAKNLQHAPSRQAD